MHPALRIFLRSTCALPLLSVSVLAAYPQAAPVAVAPPAVTVTSVAVFSQSTVADAAGAATQTFILEVTGTNFDQIADMGRVSIAVMPSAGVSPNPIRVLSRSLDNTKIIGQFTAPPTYTLQEVVLSTGAELFPISTGTLACDFRTKVRLVPQIVPKSQAGNKYGNGVAKNFYAIQISVVNECPMAIIIPLGGISVAADDAPSASDPAECREEGALVAFSLDHVTSVFSADRKLTGRRAIYFNSLQAVATIGSAIQPFFGSGFAKGVAILGGGFTTASKEVFVDMSAEQLQNLASQSFGATEQVASHGSLQKFVFVRRNEGCKNSTIESDIRIGKFSVNWQLSPASSQAPQTLQAPAAAQ
jgi:hypothetical protein